MPRGGLDWDDEKLKRVVSKGLERGMGRGMIYAVGQVRKSINRGNAGGDNPSKPGEPPKKVSSLLFFSIAFEVVRERGKIVGRFGTNKKYGKRLELGFFGTDKRGRNIRQAPRPFLRRVLIRHGRKVGKIIGKG